MSLPRIASPADWRTARMALLEEEKALTRTRDAVNARRRELPMVRVEADYRFEGPDGEVGLLDLFGGHAQLVIGHFMFAPEWEDGCASCSAGADEVAAGKLAHLAARDTALAYVSRAPYARIADYKRRRGWTFPWYSSHGSAFNYDFHVTLDPAVAPVEYNFRTAAEHAERGVTGLGEGPFPMEMPGTSVFLRVGDDVFHTYSSYARAAEDTGSSYDLLDLTALGRQEDWELPAGRARALRDAPA